MKLGRMTDLRLLSLVPLDETELGPSVGNNALEYLTKVSIELDEVLLESLLLLVIELLQ